MAYGIGGLGKVVCHINCDAVLWMGDLGKLRTSACDGNGLRIFNNISSFFFSVCCEFNTGIK